MASSNSRIIRVANVPKRSRIIRDKTCTFCMALRVHSIPLAVDLCVFDLLNVNGLMGELRGFVPPWVAFITYLLLK